MVAAGIDCSVTGQGVSGGRVQSRRAGLEAHVEIDPRYYRPAEVDLLIGDPSKAKRKLSWEPKKKLEDLAKLMVDADIKLLRRHRHGEIKVAR